MLPVLVKENMNEEAYIWRRRYYNGTSGQFRKDVTHPPTGKGVLILHYLNDRSSSTLLVPLTCVLPAPLPEVGTRR